MSKKNTMLKTCSMALLLSATGAAVAGNMVTDSAGHPVMGVSQPMMADKMDQKPMMHDKMNKMDKMDKKPMMDHNMDSMDKKPMMDDKMDGMDKKPMMDDKMKK